MSNLHNMTRRAVAAFSFSVIFAGLVTALISLAARRAATPTTSNIERGLSHD